MWYENMMLTATSWEYIYLFSLAVHILKCTVKNDNKIFPDLRHSLGGLLIKTSFLTAIMLHE